jgi:pimeloyl-ACP methyl ester carboxylesterase
MDKLAQGNRFPSKYIAADGVKIHYQESGTGIPLVCIHGTSPGAFGWGDFHQNIDQFGKPFAPSGSTSHNTDVRTSPLFKEID